MDPAYAERYRELAARHWWWRARNDTVGAEVARLLGERRDARILDVGCGDAVLFPYLSKFGHVEGIEPDPTVVSAESPWRNRIRIAPFDESLRPAPSERPGARVEGFDLILMLDVLEHLDDAAASLRLAGDLLEAEGRLLVTVPAFLALWTHHDELNRHVTRFTRGRLTAAANAAGLRVERSWYLFQWLFFAKLVERARERAFGPAPPPSVPPERINDVLYRVCEMERRVAGRAVPFGSSLIAILSRAGSGGRQA
jgi:SAM-dependent methyltransferase